MPDIGPQSSKDPPFTARMRLHQSWYRARVLKVPYGVGPRQSSKTFYGNMLAVEDGERGLNFLAPHIFHVARRRLSEKKGLMDRFSFLCDMLSSQALCFNLIGPLVDDRELASGLSRVLVEGEVGRVQRVRMEYIPEPAGEYINAPAGFNAFIEFEGPDGRPAFIGIETYLAEGFLAQGLKSKTSVQPSYWKWTKREGSPWPEEAWPQLVEREVNRLWRGHLLQQALVHRPGSRYTTGNYLVLYHPRDEASLHAIRAYRRLLRPEEKTFSALPLDAIASRWMQAVTRNADRDWLGEFVRRYLDFSESEGELLNSE